MARLIWLGRIVLFGVAALVGESSFSADPVEAPRLVLQTGTSYPVEALAFSPNGKIIASGSLESVIKLWDAPSGSELRTLIGHRSVTCVVFSPDGETLASASKDQTVKLWDVMSGRELRTLAGHTGSVLSLAFSPDGQTLASSSSDKTVKLWNVALGQELHTLTGNLLEVKLVAFSPDGTLLTSASDDAVQLWSVANGQLVRSFMAPAIDLFKVMFSTDGKSVEAATETGIVRWDVATGAKTSLLTESSAVGEAVALSTDEKTLAASKPFYHTIDLWDVGTGQVRRTLAAKLPVEKLAFAPDGKTLLAGGNGGWLKTWDVASGRVLQTFSGRAFGVRSIALSRDGKKLALASAGLNLWDAVTGQESRPLDETTSVDAVTFSADGTLASGSAYGVVKLWDINSQRELRSFPGTPDDVLPVALSPNGLILAWTGDDGAVRLSQTDGSPEVRAIGGHALMITTMAFSPGGRTLATGSRDQSIKLWEVSSGRLLRTLAGHKDAISEIAFSRDGQVLASGSRDKTVKLWDVASGRELRTLAGNGGAITSVAYSPNGEMLASGSEDHNIRLWELKSGRQLRTLSGHSAAVTSVSFSIDGKVLASGSADKTTKLWDVSNGQVVRTLDGHGHEIRAVRFSPGGATLATASNDSMVRQWDWASGRELRALRVLRSLSDAPAWINSIAFSADGHFLAASSTDRALHLWEISQGWDHTPTLIPEFIWSVALSVDGKMLASAGMAPTVVLRDIDGSGARFLVGHTGAIFSVAFAPDGKTLASAGGDQTVKLWDTLHARELRTLTGHAATVTSVAFSPDGKILATGSDDTTTRLWDVASGREVRTLNFGDHGAIAVSPLDVDSRGLHLFGNQADGVWAVAFSPDGRTLATAGKKNIKLWDVASGQELHTLSGHGDRITSLAFSPDGKVLISSSDDKTIKLWRMSDAALMGSLTSFYGNSSDQVSWAVTDAEGRYDASNAGGNSNLHWVVGMTPVALEQLKERYYEPGLLAKLMGYNTEPLRSVPKFDAALAQLYPEVLAQFDSAHPLQLVITLRDQGGGYGRVRVRLNGKELTPDARNGRHLAAKTETLTLTLTGESLLPTGNAVDIVAWNADGSMSSPPSRITLEQLRGAKALADTANAKSEPPKLFAIVMGVAHYREASLDLTFSGKDAHDFAQAITLGADRLFGADKVQMHLLSDYQDKGAAGERINLVAQSPTRENLQSAFAQVSKAAKPGDILVVFLAGHGVMGVADGDYYYLTNDAQGLDLTDPAVRKLWGVSSVELTEWIKQIHANKQMMVLDTCAAGGALEKLTAKRDVPSSQIIALDRLKDRTGFYVLAGAAADRVSYETTRFGQGLLTRALLTGMKGAALRDGEFVDVAHLFQYARDQVPVLAQQIGGIQAPMVAAPRGDSFDVGEMLPDDRRAVPLADVRAMMLRGTFQDEDQMADLLKLSSRFNQRLRAENAVTVRGRLSFIDADDFPDAWGVVGRYRKTPEGLKVTARLLRNGEPKSTVQLTLTGNDSEQVEQLFGAVMKQVGEDQQ